MNKRIKELINEATSFKEGLIEGKHDIEEFDKEKFAELIVRECAEYMNEFADNGDQRNSNDLLKHFGVEE
jgi:uncharacterized coiled-coil DUF342 family protein